MSLTTQIEAVSNKLYHLVKQYQHLQKENQRLEKENHQLKQQSEQRIQQSQQLQQKMEALKITSGDLSEDMKRDLEKRVNGYLKEIDKCLKMLNT